ncbi:MAG: protein kinase [Candidatus Limnocylindrales bacterium]
MTEPREPTVPAPERLVGGRYRLGPVIGRGGMATVHRATDTRLEREVAVKLLRPEVSVDADLAQRFRREALAATVLRHSNIVACLDTGTDGEQPYLVMELVDGEDLAARLRRGGRLEPWQAARIGLDVARALGVAHIRGIVHRDVKPGNILLAADGRAKVTDFGIARLAMDAEATMPGTTLGSVHYFSPEQARGATTTPASDIYSLGLVLYESLTGTRPWTGDTTDAIALARIGVTAPSVRTLRPEVPQVLADVVTRALSPQPADRYANGVAMAAALESIVVAADPSSPTSLMAIPSPVPPAVVAAPQPARVARLAPSGPPDSPVMRPSAPMARRMRRRRSVMPSLAIVAIAMIGLALGAWLVSALPGSDGSIAFQTDQPTLDPTPGPTLDPTPEPTPSPSPSPEVTAQPTTAPTAEPSAEPTPVPLGEVADLCEIFFDLPCGLGAGRYGPSRFSPAFDIELGSGWSAVSHEAGIVVLQRDEGLMTFMSGIAIVDPEGAATAVRDRSRNLIEALVTMDGVAATEPADVRIDGRRGLSIDVATVDPVRLAVFANGESTFYLEPGRTTRLVALDTRDGMLMLAIEPADGSGLDDILATADIAAGAMRWR